MSNQNPPKEVLAKFLQNLKNLARDPDLTTLEYRKEIEEEVARMNGQLLDLLDAGDLDPEQVNSNWRGFIPSTLTPYLTHSHNPKLPEPETFLIEAAIARGEVKVYYPGGREVIAGRKEGKRKKGSPTARVASDLLELLAKLEQEEEEEEEEEEGGR